MISCENRFSVGIFLLLSIGVFFNRAINLEKDVVFQLYTPESPNSFSRLNASDSKTISGSTFKPELFTIIFCYGLKSKENVTMRFKEAYLKLGDFNFIGVDWISGTRNLAPKDRLPTIASKLANLLDKLANDHGLHLPNVTMVGHGLGAHIAGRAAKLLKSSDKLGFIVGLDPDGYGLDVSKSESRLDKSDAEYVQIIHTDGSRFGIIEPIGHADFYPNTGKDQPGCPKGNLVSNPLSKHVIDEKCSHARAHDLFLESLTTKFEAIRCGSFQEIRKNVCTSDNTTALMGDDILGNALKPDGIFYLETNDKSPFVINNTLKFKNPNFTVSYN